ncbi:MAG: hypothetical protein EAX87_05555 [Candidatus Thorarchaeota archaeon]|nr:hypothetical protein [Candidatus Thorarchaeota archaeon]
MSVRLSNKTLVVMGVLIIFGWFMAQVIVSLLFPTSTLPFSIPSIGAEIVFVSVLLGFTLYNQRLRDERSIQISDKSARNGFAFVLFVVPMALIGLSATDVSSDALLALVVIWIGAVFFAGISAFYYYYR